MKTGHAVFARDVDGFDGGVETILHVLRREHDARRIAVAAEEAMFRSVCSTFVGMPVEGPPRWTLTTISGTSAMTAQPSASILSEMPGPAAGDGDAAGEDAPMAIEMAAISSSDCTKVPPYFGSSPRSISMMSDHGVIG